MPYETINYPDHGEGFEPEISIHWMPGDDIIQFGVKLRLDKLAENIDLLQKHSPRDIFAEFYTTPIDRRTMQKLVKVARRARDAVHGADE